MKIVENAPREGHQNFNDSNWINHLHLSEFQCPHKGEEIFTFKVVMRITQTPYPCAK